MPIFIDAIARGGASVAFIMPEHIAKTDPFKQITETIGSGPYKFLPDEFVAGAHAGYARNPDYMPRQEPADWMVGGKIAHFDRIEWRVIPDSATAAAALQSGEVDWYEQVQPDLVPLLRRNRDIRIGIAQPHRLQWRAALQPSASAVQQCRGAARGDHGREPGRLHGLGHRRRRAAYQTCKSMLPCGSRYGQEVGAEAMQGDVAKAKAMLQASGYNGEKVVLLNPTDLTTVGPLGDVTHDLLVKIGMNVEMVATDWGTVVQRRASREPVEKGGWSILHTWAPSSFHARRVQQIPRPWPHRMVRLVRGRHDGGVTRRFVEARPRRSAMRRGAIHRERSRWCRHPAGHLPDPHRLSQQPDRRDRGDRPLLLEHPQGIGAASVGSRYQRSLPWRLVRPDHPRVRRNHAPDAMAADSVRP